jgi:hypothetical protein
MRAVGDDLDRRTRTRATAAVVLLAAGLVVAVAAPIVGGDGFLRADSWRSVRESAATHAIGEKWWAGQVEGPSFAPHGDPVDLNVWVSAAPGDDEDFVSIVTSDPGWIAATVALVAIPLWFWWWRRGAVGFARGIGVLASAGATAALVALSWPATEFCAAHVLVAAAVAYLAAFLVAPDPRAADDE